MYVLIESSILGDIVIGYYISKETAQDEIINLTQSGVTYCDYHIAKIL